MDAKAGSASAGSERPEFILVGTEPVTVHAHCAHGRFGANRVPVRRVKVFAAEIALQVAIEASFDSKRERFTSMLDIALSLLLPQETAQPDFAKVIV